MRNKLNSVFKIIFSLYLFLLSASILSQIPEILIDNGINAVYNTDVINVYGLDFSTLKLVNPDKLGIDSLLKYVYFPGWSSNFELDYPEEKLRKTFSSLHLNYKVHQFQENQYLKSNVENIVVVESDMLSVDKIRAIVLDYSIEETHGIGFSIIVEEFHKRKERVTTLFVFFDVHTKDLLYVFRAFGDANGVGMRYHWETGIQEPLDKYLDFRFKKELKKNRI